MTTILGFRDIPLTAADVVWTPARHGGPRAGEIRVERHGSGWKRSPGDLWMPAKALGEFGHVKAGRLGELLALFILLNTVTIRDGIAPQRAHAALMAIPEYRRAISPDIPGADR